MRRLLAKLGDLLFGSPRIATVEDLERGAVSKQEFERQKREQDQKVSWLKSEARLWANHG